MGWVSAVVAVGQGVYQVFAGQAKMRKANRANVIAFWEPVLGLPDVWPRPFVSWIWGKYRSAPRRAKRGARLTNQLINGRQETWQELADTLGQDMPSMEFWANYLGWPAGEYGQHDPNATISQTGGNLSALADNNIPNKDLKTSNLLPLAGLGLAGLLILKKK